MSPLQVAMMRARNVPRPIPEPPPEPVFEVMIGHHKPHREAITVASIVATVARFYRITTADIRGKCRMSRNTVPRHVAIYLAKMILAPTSMGLGRYFALDHSSILHAINKITRGIENDAKLASDIAEIRRRIVAR